MTFKQAGFLLTQPTPKCFVAEAKDPLIVWPSVHA
jgi:hypothetical protein